MKRIFTAMIIIFTVTLTGGCMEDKNKNLKEKLTPIQYSVTQQCGTEPPFNNEYWNNKSVGLYVDIVSGEPLFSSGDKFDSGTGWPSFVKPIFEDSIIETSDNTSGMSRIEVKSKIGKSHLGHVFPDGPPPYKTRFCINSASLKFIPVEKLAEEGYGKYIILYPDYIKKIGLEYAVFGGGCFWGTEAYFKKVNGVKATMVGYTGGTVVSPSYEEVCTGKTGHVESVILAYDKKSVSYDDLLKHFWRIHNPTSLNRQGNDVGSQYRSAVFYFNEEQKKSITNSINIIQKKFTDPIVTEVKPASEFYPAEFYHQDYLDKNPNGYCHINLNLATKPVE